MRWWEYFSNPAILVTGLMSVLAFIVSNRNMRVLKTLEKRLDRDLVTHGAESRLAVEIQLKATERDLLAASECARALGTAVYAARTLFLTWTVDQGGLETLVARIEALNAKSAAAVAAIVVLPAARRTSALLCLDDVDKTSFTIIEWVGAQQRALRAITAKTGTPEFAAAIKAASNEHAPLLEKMAAQFEPTAARYAAALNELETWTDSIRGEQRAILDRHRTDAAKALPA